MLTRRSLIEGCAALMGTLVTRSSLARATTGRVGEALVVISLRGGWDALSAIPPLDGVDRGIYEKARPSLKIPARKLLPLNQTLGLHPSARPLYELYQAGKLAVVTGVGLEHDTRSHFDAIEFIEQGTPGKKGGQSGWMARHLQSCKIGGPLTALQIGGPSSCLMGYPEAVVVGALEQDWVLPSSSEDVEQLATLGRLYAGDSSIARAGTEALKASRRLEKLAARAYRPGRGVKYPDSDFATSLQAVARLLKSDVGMRVATVELEGWDTHEEQGEYFSSLLAELSSGLKAFYEDVQHCPVTVVVMSEFGRRLAENASQGTDHGHGGAMLVLGSGVVGGRVHGQWPGLAKEMLYDLEDLRVTTDFRQVLGEIVEKKLGNPALGEVFPGFSDYRPLGLVWA